MSNLLGDALKEITKLTERNSKLKAELAYAVRLQKIDEKRFKDLADKVSKLPNVNKTECDNCEGYGCCGCEGLGFTLEIQEE